MIHSLGLGFWALLARPAAGLIEGARGRSTQRIAAGIFDGVQGLVSSTIFAASNAAAKASISAQKAI